MFTIFFRFSCQVLAIGVSVFLAFSVFAETLLTLPSKKSQFNGLYGITVKKGIRCKDCCDLIFPETFGLDNRAELEFLKKIINKGSKIKHDVDCVMPIDYDVLDHVRFLAIKKQDKGAASLLLYPPAHGGFNLGGGELEEIYADQYIRPILEKYNKLGDLLNQKAVDYVADKICLSWVNPTIESDMNLSELIKGLKKKKLNNLANAIELTCKKYESDFGAE